MEQFLGNLQKDANSASVILLDSEMESNGSNGVSPKANAVCTNTEAAACGSNGKCANFGKACGGASNASKCDNFVEVVSKDPCSAR